MQTVNCKEIHSGRLQTTAAYKASAEELIAERIIKKTRQLSWLVNVTTVFRTSVFYPHIRI